ncbi:MAG: hypothetical protein ACOYYS_27880 [Chloroflexota bacterium]
MPTATPKPSTAKPTTPTEAPAATTDDTGEPSNEIPPYVAAQMDIIQEEVIELRGLSPNQPVDRALLTPEQLRKRVIEDFLAEYTPEEAQEDVAVLAAFGLLEPGFDLLHMYQELFSEQVAGFYDNETKEMYVVQDEAFEGTQRMTYAHEYTHVLQDQTYDFENGLGYDEEACEEDSERCAAIQSLIEGDATLAELHWFQKYSTDEDKQQVMEFYGSYESPVYDNAPEFLKQDFLFPYQNGLLFVQALYDDGGWEAVDAAYDNLPLSTEQILHPEKYPADVPVQVTLPDLSDALGSGWEEIDRGVMGEWYTYLILGHGADEDARLDTGDAEDAAAGWSGDSYVVYANGENSAVAMAFRSLWETEGDATEFIEAFQAYATARFGEPLVNESGHLAWQDASGYHDLYYAGLQTTWMLAPDAGTAQAIWAAVKP